MVLLFIDKACTVCQVKDGMVLSKGAFLYHKKELNLLSWMLREDTVSKGNRDALRKTIREGCR